ncbi:retrovirus-related pol polyprotein from transposon TNT 1-94 [Tanacetum coccineum]
MSDTVPPIPPPFGANTGNLSSPIRAGNLTDTINNITTTNVVQNVVDENLPQLRDSRGGSHITNVPEFDEEDFSNLILTHEGPSKTKDTKIAALRLKFNASKALKGEKVNGTFTRLKSLLNDLENNGVLIPQAEVNATFGNNLPRKWLSMNQTQRDNNSIKNDTLASLYGKYNYEEGLINQIYKSESTRFTLQGSKALISNPTLQESDSDIEDDQRSNSEFLANLNAEFHERALLANQRRFYKRSGRVGSQKKPMDRVKYKGVKAKITVVTKKIDAINKGKSEKGLVAESFDWDEELVSFDNEGVTTFKALMAIADEPSVGRADARSGQWVEITMNKVQKLLSITDSDERKHVLDYTHVDLHFVEDQRKNLLRKYNSLKQEFSSCKNIVKAIGGKRKRKEKSSSKEIVFTKSDVSTSETSLKISSDSESKDNTQRPLHSLPKLIGAEPSGVTKCLTITKPKQPTDNMLPLTIKHRVETKPTLNLSTEKLLLTLIKEGSSRKALMILKPYIPFKYCGFNDHHSDECEFYHGCDLCGSIAHETSDCRYVWYLDSGCSRHITGVKQYLHIYSKESGPKVEFGDNSLGDTEGYGLVNCNGITFTKGAIFNQTQEVVLIAPRRRDVYVIDMTSYNEESNSSYEKGKHHRASFKTKRTFSINKFLHLLHMDLFRHGKPQSISHNKYTLVIVNEYSRYTLVFCLKKKSDVADCIISFVRKMENLNEVKVKELRSDNGTKFKNYKLEKFCDEKGIYQNFSSPCTPEQNGIAKSRNKTLIETATTMLNSANLPKQFWGEAVNTACYTQNRSIIVKRPGKTAYDVFRGRSLDISYFHVFRCLVHIHNHKDHLGKFDDGFFLGYSPVAKAFRVFNIIRQEMEETYHVTFSEDDEAISQSSTKAYDPLSSNNISIPECLTSADSHHAQDSVSPEEHVELQHTCNTLKSEYAAECFLIKQDFRGIFIYQGKYVKDLLKKYDLADSALVKCLMLPLNNLSPDESGVFVNETLFRGMIGSLMYLTASRPDIQFSTCLCARYQANPKESHLVAVKRIFRYLKGTPNLGLWYPKGSGFDLKAYSDSDYARCNLNRKSTLIGCQILGGKLVCWSVKKQNSMPMSSAEAEYVAAAGCCPQVLWIKSQLVDYDVLYDKVPILCDNISATAISNNLVLHSRTKHIDIRYHFIKDHILKGDIELHFVPTDLQLADIFNKPLAKPSFTRLIAELGMLNIKSEIFDKKKDLNDLT